MTEQRLLFIDIEAESKSPSAFEGGAKKPLWTHSDNSFRFDFSSDSFSVPREKASPSDWTEAATSQISFTGQSSAFAFNFQIPTTTPAEDMDTTETPDTCSSRSQQCVQEEEASLALEVIAPPEPSEQSKTKKKKKSGKKKPESETQQKPAEGSQGEKQLTVEEQLNRQLDWCIEQLELGLKTQKGTPKQKEEASRSLKTLRSSKAPLAKKRQVMRAMTGDYRKKMEDEKSKQFKLIQSEIASAQVKVVSDSPKKSIFHRRAEVKTQPPATEGNLQETKAQDNTKPKLQTHEQTSDFVFVPSKEEFCFNFF
ncbi:UPF0488 protein C8orf33 homolog [Melanotaenia boesemani]|uniref:UPF0488 protein C8orf33 homolog n=1 Tax=Melanotaenia boesemani TaxID=1250792 RepID=UPI001C04FEA1|nr:UPF0488 protein C8orf33 homolog [Melanotaenia boesemani]